VLAGGKRQTEMSCSSTKELNVLPKNEYRWVLLPLKTEWPIKMIVREIL
jgi:hypothetical protein